MVQSGKKGVVPSGKDHIRIILQPVKVPTNQSFLLFLKNNVTGMFPEWPQSQAEAATRVVHVPRGKHIPDRLIPAMQLGESGRRAGEQTVE